MRRVEGLRRKARGKEGVVLDMENVSCQLAVQISPLNGGSQGSSHPSEIRILGEKPLRPVPGHLPSKAWQSSPKALMLQ